MATYKIIGGDQKEYGPVTTEQLRQWIAEGRVNGQTLVQPEGAAEWKPLSTIPEFAGTLGGFISGAPPVPRPAGTAASPPPEVVLGRDFDLDIGSCISRGWALVKQRFWLVIGVSLLVLVVQAALNQLIGLFTTPVIKSMIEAHHFSVTGILIIFAASVLGTPIYSVLMAGMFKFYLKLIRGENAGVADAFSGFGPATGQLVLLGLVTGCLALIGYALCILPGIYLTVSWIFAIPLVIDRRMEFWEALEFSRKVVAKHWFVVFAFLLVVGLVSIAGLIACCIGILVTIPIGQAAMMYAYEDIFSRQTS